LGVADGIAAASILDNVSEEAGGLWSVCGDRVHDQKHGGVAVVANEALFADTGAFLSRHMSTCGGQRVSGDICLAMALLKTLGH